MTGMMMSNASRSVSISLGHGQTIQATGNRCRADSGSTYSSSDTSNRSKTSSRRRSHRPRGCRGGSSRKKRRGGKVPKEIGGAATDVVSAKTMDVLTSNKKTMSVQESRHQKVTVSFAEESRKPSKSNISDENAGRVPSTQAYNVNKYLPLTSNAAVYGENNKNDAMAGPLKSKTLISSNSCLPPLQESMKSLLLASKEQQQQSNRPSYSNSAHNNHTMETPLKSNVTGRGFSQPQILPPLYHPEPAVTLSQEPTFQGPNIYALHNTHTHTHSIIHNTHRDNKNIIPRDDIHNNTIVNNNRSDNVTYPYMDNYHDGRSHQLYGYDNHNSYSQCGANIHTMQPNQFVVNDNSIINNGSNTNYEAGFLRFRAENRPEAVSYNNFGHTAMNSNSNNKLRKSSKTPGSSYRTERIEKQRQMMAGGGSLFVTSPKSFLMGWKSDEMPRM